MPTLLSHEVTNSEVKAFKGLHLYHSKYSHCCRQVRLALSLKEIEYVSHEIDVESKIENMEQNYLNINPRGLVPTLVHNGKVIIETIDILLYIDKTFQGSQKGAGSNYIQRLIPGEHHDKIVNLIEGTDQLNMAIRTITVSRLPRSVQKLKAKRVQICLLRAMKQEQERNDKKKRTIGGVLESNVRGQTILENVKFWRKVTACDFNKDERSVAYSKIFESFLRFETSLIHTQYLLGNKDDDRFTLVDVAWWPIVGRFYNILNKEKKEQFRTNAPNLWKWYERIKLKPAFRVEAEDDSFFLRMVAGYKHSTDVSDTVAFAVFVGAIVLLWLMVKYEL